MSMLTKNLSLTSSTGFSRMDTIFKAVMSDDSKIQKNVIKSISGVGVSLGLQGDHGVGTSAPFIVEPSCWRMLK